MEFVFLNGQFLRGDKAKVSVFDHGFLYGDGVYETLRTYNGKVWLLDEHLARLERSVKALRLKLPYNRKKLAAAVLKVTRMNGHKESRIRIEVSRGANDFDFFTCKRPTVLVAARPLDVLPKKSYTAGVRAVAVHGGRAMPEVKSISQIAYIAAQQQVKAKKAYEGIYVDEKGLVREGTITNVFIVKKGVVYTPESGMLGGLTRDFLIKLLKKNRMRVVVGDFSVQKLRDADEIFLTNTTKGIIPVSHLNTKKIGRGKPGVVTSKLTNLFHAETYGR